MDIKKLFIITVFVVGLTPNNTRTGTMPYQYTQAMNENERFEWQVVPQDNELEEEQEAAEPLISFVEKHRPQPQCSQLPGYQSRPANVSFHTQTQPCNATPEDPYAPCDSQFQEREMEELETEEEGQPYVVIYKVQE
jgi:hypothetical protein